MWAAKIQTVAVTSTQTPMDFQLEDWEQSWANLFSAAYIRYVGTLSAFHSSSRLTYQIMTI
jgi:hypothetical protein